jgi:hypothetical protein
MDVRRAGSARALRLGLLGLLLAWFFSPPQWRYSVPLWLPFVLAALLELQFFLGGLRGASSRAERGRGPLTSDLEEFGWGGDAVPDEADLRFWESPPVPKPERRPLARRLLEPALVFAAVGLVVWAVSVERGWGSLDPQTQRRFERTLARAVRPIAGHTARIHCDTSGKHVGVVQEADGLAEVGGRDAWLTPSICYRLYKHEASSFSATGRAIAVLAHEAWHLRGVADEGLANCYAFQSGTELGVRLGLSRGTAVAMMREQLADNPSDAAGDSRYLVPPGCKDGGRYDLRRDSRRFP